MSTPEIMEPSACTWCGIARRGHGRQYADAAGWHGWEQPSQEQMLARMKARRLARVVAEQGALPVPVGPEPLPLDVLLERSTTVAKHLSEYSVGLGDVWDWLVGYGVPELVSRLAELASWKARDEEVQPHRQAVGAANARIIGALELRIRRVRMLHSRGWGAESERCQHDGEQWPCPTLAALDAAVGQATHEAPTAKPTEPTQGLRNEDPNGLHHDYRISRDLPELGGA